MIETKQPVTVRADREGVKVNGVLVPGVARIEFYPGGAGKRPRAALLIEADIVTAVQCPENKHLFGREFDRLTLNRYNSNVDDAGEKPGAAL